MRSSRAIHTVSRSLRGDRGTVTAELAVVLPTLVVVLSMLVWALTATAAQLRCVDAARAAARSLARGDNVATATALVRTLAPERARLTVSWSGGWVRAQVTAPPPGPPALPAALPALSCAATLPVEERPWQ